MQNPTPWIFHVLMTTTLELRDNYQLTVHLFCCRTKAQDEFGLCLWFSEWWAHVHQHHRQWAALESLHSLEKRTKEGLFTLSSCPALSERWVSVTTNIIHNCSFLIQEKFISGMHSLSSMEEEFVPINWCPPSQKAGLDKRKGFYRKKTNLQHHLLLGYQWENQLNILLACTGCVGLSCFTLLSSEQTSASWWKNHHTHFAIWATLWFRIHPPPVAVQHPLPTPSCQQFRKHKKRGGSLCQALARQGHCVYKSICQGTKPSHTSLILNKIHLQCSSDANVHCGRTNNRFVWAERFFYDLFNFKINFSLWNTY